MKHKTAEAIGIDIGGTKIRAILVRGRKIVAVKEIKTPRTSRALKAALLQLADGFSGRNTARTHMVGVGAAGVISESKIIFSPNVRYLRHFRFDFLKPIFISRSFFKLDNDARCFLRAEIFANNALKKKNVLGIILGTGIGRAVADSGRVLKIKKLEYPEKWEKEYQKTRDLKNGALLADLVSKKIQHLIAKYSPSAIVLGGGVIARKYIFALLNKKIRAAGFTGRIFRSKLWSNHVAIGAILQFGRNR